MPVTTKFRVSVAAASAAVSETAAALEAATSEVPAAFEGSAAADSVVWIRDSCVVFSYVLPAPQPDNSITKARAREKMRVFLLMDIAPRIN